MCCQSAQNENDRKRTFHVVGEMLTVAEPQPLELATETQVLGDGEIHALACAQGLAAEPRQRGSRSTVARRTRQGRQPAGVTRQLLRQASEKRAVRHKLDAQAVLGRVDPCRTGTKLLEV